MSIDTWRYTKYIFSDLFLLTNKIKLTFLKKLPLFVLSLNICLNIYVYVNVNSICLRKIRLTNTAIYRATSTKKKRCISYNAIRVSVTHSRLLRFPRCNAKLARRFVFIFIDCFRCTAVR